MRISDWSSDVCSSDLQCTAAGLAVPALPDAARDQMRALLLSVATASNPLDLTPSTAFQPEAFAQLPKVIDILGAQEQIHSLLFICGSMGSKGAEIADAMADAAARSPKPFNVSRSEEHTSELQSLMRISYAVFCLKKKKTCIR